MSDIYQIRKVIHQTFYKYETATDFSKQICVLSPTENQAIFNGPLRRGQTLINYELNVEPKPSTMVSYSDYLDNKISHFEITFPHDYLTVTSVCEVNVYPSVLEPNNANFANTPYWDEIAQNIHYMPGKPIEFDTVFRFASKHVDLFEDARNYGLTEFWEKRPIVEAAYALMNRIHTEFSYIPGVTHINTPVHEVLNTRQGVCQDFAHLMLSIFRSLGLSARYVSGYMLTDPPAGQEKLIGADASHAWVSLWCGPEYGWVDLDPTNNKLPDQRYVTTALGRDYSDIPPLRGIVFGGGTHELKVEVTVS